MGGCIYSESVTAPRLAIHDRLIDLSDATRCRLLVALERQELTVGELSTALQLPQSTVSRHLKILADQGWVDSRSEGTSRWYRRHSALDADMAQLWDVVRISMISTPVSIQDSARIDAVLASRRTKSQAFFAEAGADWDTLRASMFGPRSDLAALLALLDPTAVVGDLGCGTGTLVASLAPHVARVHAVDASPAMLRAASVRLAGHPNVVVQEGAIESLPLANATLDIAILMLVLHHIADPPRALREVRRVLRPGGRMLLVDMRPHAQELYREQMGHVWLGFDASTIAAWCTDAGFDSPRHVELPVDATVNGPALFSVVARCPM